VIVLVWINGNVDLLFHFDPYQGRGSVASRKLRHPSRSRKLRGYLE